MNQKRNRLENKNKSEKKETEKQLTLKEKNYQLGKVENKTMDGIEQGANRARKTNWRTNEKVTLKPNAQKSNQVVY